MPLVDPVITATMPDMSKRLIDHQDIGYKSPQSTLAFDLGRLTTSPTERAVFTARPS
jgi:hypothetical protein